MKVEGKKIWYNGGYWVNKMNKTTRDLGIGKGKWNL